MSLNLRQLLERSRAQMSVSNWGLKFGCSLGQMAAGFHASHTHLRTLCRRNKHHQASCSRPSICSSASGALSWVLFHVASADTRRPPSPNARTKGAACFHEPGRPEASTLKPMHLPRHGHSLQPPAAHGQAAHAAHAAHAAQAAHAAHAAHAARAAHAAHVATASSSTACVSICLKQP